MAVFAISDLHLSLSTDKPMDIFGWSNHTERIKANWNRVVKENDTVIIPGDISWGLKMSEAAEDLKFIDLLNGKKIILKGNHDLWWQTMAKNKRFFADNGIKSIDILFNNSFSVEDFEICGTRGWFYDAGNDRKVILREAGRLEASLSFNKDTKKEKIVFLHYPPVFGEQVCDEIWQVIKKHNVKRVFYGHVHGIGYLNCLSEYDNVKLKLVACDHTDFTPVEIIK